MKLFEPISIGSLELKNRIVMPPMVVRYGNSDSTVSQRLIEYYRRRAEGGAAMIIVEATRIDPVHYIVPQQIGAFSDHFLPGLSALAAAIKEAGAAAAIQIHHPGRRVYRQFSDIQPVGPSPIAVPAPNFATPRELTTEEIQELVARFARAARRCQEAGFDAVELHMAHGYLLSQFLSAFSNRRTDEYGGDVYARARFPLEVARATRAMVGDDFTLYARVSADEQIPGGISVEETRVVAGLLQEAGMDAVSVSAGSTTTGEWSTQPMFQPRGCLVPWAARIKEAVGIPVMVAGRINDPRLAESVLQEGKADIICMGRPLIADPDLPRKAQEGRYDEITRCIACMMCSAQMHRKDIACVLNPEVGRERRAETPAARSRRVLVLGGGPAGLEAARVARLRGHKVALWDRRQNLEDRWSFLIRAALHKQLATLDKLGVEVSLGKEFNAETVSQARPDVVIATAEAHPGPSDLPGATQPHVVQAEDVLSNHATVRRSAVVLGGSSVGCEVARHLLASAVQVTILESSPSAGGGFENRMARMLGQDLERRGARILTGAEPLRIDGKRVVYRNADGVEAVVEADSVVLTGPYVTDDNFAGKLKSRGLEVHAVSYCERPSLALSAAEEGAEIARSL